MVIDIILCIQGLRVQLALFSMSQKTPFSEFGDVQCFKIYIP